MKKEKSFVMNCKLFVVSIMLVLCHMFSSYASVDDKEVQAIQRSNDYIDNYYGLHLGEKSGVLYNLDKNDNIVYGYSYDLNGNIYFTNYLTNGPGSADIGILRGEEGENGVYFDENGHLLNPSMPINYSNKEEIGNGIVIQDIIDYKALAEEFETEGSIKFKNLKETEDFLEYYILQYSLDNLKADKYKLERVSILNLDGKELEVGYRLTFGGNITEREEVINAIFSYFGKIEGNTTQEKMYDVCNKLEELMEYDLTYEPSSLLESIKSGKGVCWQYAKIAKILLDDAGVDNELMIGYLNGNRREAHAWLRITEKVYDDLGINNEGDGLVSETEDMDVTSVRSYKLRYYYMDPTSVESTGEYKYSNLSYREYCNRYEVSRYVDIY